MEGRREGRGFIRRFGLISPPCRAAMGFGRRGGEGGGGRLGGMQWEVVGVW